MLNEETINKITEILSGLNNLEVLDLSGLHIINDISFISNMESLKELNLANNNITNLRPLSFLTNLEKLDISPIEKLTNLCFLWLEDNNISKIDVLNNLNNLVSLELKGNKIPHTILIEFFYNHDYVEVDNLFNSSDSKAYKESLEAKRYLKSLEYTRIPELLIYDTKYLNVCESVFIDDSLFFELNQTKFDLILEKLAQMNNIKELVIVGPTDNTKDRNYDLTTDENIKKLFETVNGLESLETLRISFFYSLNDTSIIYSLPNLIELDLSNNGFTEEELDEVYKKIYNRLKVYTKKKVLSLKLFFIIHFKV